MLFKLLLKKGLAFIDTENHLKYRFDFLKLLSINNFKSINK